MNFLEGQISIRDRLFYLKARQGNTEKMVMKLRGYHESELDSLFENTTG